MNGLQQKILDSYDRILKSPGLQNTMWLGGASMVNALLGALTTAVYARLLGVTDFGVLTLLISLTTMLTTLADLGIGGVVIRFLPERLAVGDRGGIDNVLSYALRGKVALASGVLVFSLVLAAPLVGLVFGHISEHAVDLFIVMLIAVAASSGSEFLRSIYYGFRGFRRHSLVAIVPSAVKVLLASGVALALGSVSLRIIVGIEIVSAVLGCVVAYVYSPYKAFRWRGDDQAIRAGMIGFGKWWMVHGVMSIVAARIDVFLLGGLADVRSLGFYGAAAKITAILTMVSQSFLIALLPEVAADPSAASVGRKRARAWYLVGAFVLALLLLIALSPIVIQILFGSEFAESAELLRVMCVGVILVVLSFPFQATLFASSRSAAFSVGSGLSVVVLGFCAAVLIPRLGPMGAAIAVVAGNLVTLAVYASFAWRQRAAGLKEV